MLPRSSDCLNIPHITRCLMTNISSCLMRGRMPSVRLSFALNSFSDILETPSYFVLPPWCFKTKDCAGSGASEEKS